MNLKSAVLIALAAGCGASFEWARLSAQTTRTTWDGVYSEDQAKRGKAAYSEKCGVCHGEDLTGGDENAPLTGGAFLGNWNSLALSELAERVRITMPANNPGKMSRQQTADIVAYILQFNKFPAGAAELPPQAEVQRQIVFQSQK